MKNRVTWSLGISLMIATLVFSACAPAPATPTTPTSPTAPQTPAAPAKPATPSTPAAPAQTPAAPAGPETPQYGGVFSFATATGPLGFDEALGHRGSRPTLYLTNEVLMGGDWTKGPAGTGEAQYVIHFVPPSYLQVGRVATSWEKPDADTLVFHIRKGIKFQNKAPVNGRELDAEDVVFTLLREWKAPKSHGSLTYPWDQHFESITAPDKWTVVVKNKPGMASRPHETMVIDLVILPREIGKMDDTGWGFTWFQDWRNSVGSGAFMLTDYVEASAVAFKRNPGYWETDPIGAGKGKQLPYIDGVKWLIIPDTATRLTALRTGKIDWLPNATWEHNAAVLKTNPEMQSKEVDLGSANAIAFRVDKPELPWSDVRVRRALSMAVDKKLMLNTYFGGNGTLMAWPVANVPEFRHMFIPLEKMSPTVQEIFGYNPDKAKELLKEAGYPNGFKAKVLVSSANAVGLDLLAAIANEWKRIGVELQIDVKESGTVSSMAAGRVYDMLMTAVSGGQPLKFHSIKAGSPYNYANANDPVIEEALSKIVPVFFDESKAEPIAVSVTERQLEQAYYLQLVSPYYYMLWQPWVKNYRGEYKIGLGELYGFAKYIWIDQALKTKMGR